MDTTNERGEGGNSQIREESEEEQYYDGCLKSSRFFFFVRHLFSGLILLYGGDNIFEIRISKMKIALTIEPHNL